MAGLAAVLFLVCVLTVICGLAFSPDHTFAGPVAGVTFCLLLVSGTVLAAGAL